MTGTDIDVATGEVVTVGSVPDLAFAHSPEQTRKWMQSLQEYRRAILVNGPDFAVIPGTEKPSLLKPGAEKLLLAAGLGFTILKIDDEDARTHQGVTYRCTVRRGSLIVAECDGYAGYDESRFFTSQADAEAKERANAAKYNRAANTSKFVEYRAPWNSVIKMSQKRAMVGGVLNALAASGLFTQDIEDGVAGETAPVFDPVALMKPHLNGLTSEQTAALKEWRQSNSLPSPAQMSPSEVASALVEIGRLIAVGQTDNTPPVSGADTPLSAPDAGGSGGTSLTPDPPAPFAPAEQPEERQGPTAAQQKKWAKDIHIHATNSKVSDVDLDLIIANATRLRTQSAGELDGSEATTVINTVNKVSVDPGYMEKIRAAVAKAYDEQPAVA